MSAPTPPSDPAAVPPATEATAGGPHAGAPQQPPDAPLGTARAALDDVLATMDALMGPQGCAWTRSQTLDSLWPYLIEEAHEAAHAARTKDMAELREELGDVLLQVVYQSAVAQRAQQFTLQDVATGLTEKLVRRHPHVFDRERATTPEQVARRWEEIKAEERAARARAGRPPKGRLSGLPATLPALIYAQRATDKAASLGFDWPGYEGAAAKVQEELAEVVQAAATPGPEGHSAIEEELGDLLLSVVNVCRHLGVQAEGALLRAVAKFGRRFAHVEAGLQPGHTPGPHALDDLQRLWDEAKALKL